MFKLSKVQNPRPAGIVNTGNGQKPLLLMKGVAIANTIGVTPMVFDKVAIDLDGRCYLYTGSFYDNYFKWRPELLHVEEGVVRQALQALLKENPFKWKKGHTKYMGKVSAHAPTEASVSMAKDGSIRLEFIGKPPSRCRMTSDGLVWEYPPAERMMFCYHDLGELGRAVFSGITQGVQPDSSVAWANYILAKALA
jgi:hypothetical protein